MNIYVLIIADCSIPHVTVVPRAELRRECRAGAAAARNVGQPLPTDRRGKIDQNYIYICMLLYLSDIEFSKRNATHNAHL